MVTAAPRETRQPRRRPQPQPPAKHAILVSGVGMSSAPITTGERARPVIVKMNDDDFPARFLQDLATRQSPAALSSATVDACGTLNQPVQRILQVAMAQLACDTLGYPRLDPTRILSAGLVIRRVVRAGPGVPYDPDRLAAWVQNSSGTFCWKWLVHGDPNLDPNLDPDPTQRPKAGSGQAALDLQLAQLALASAYTESTSPAFGVPPATGAALGQTIFYGVIPTASSEVSGVFKPPDPASQRFALQSVLPKLLQARQMPANPPAPGQAVDYRWASDDFLEAFYQANTVKPQPPSTAALSVAAFQDFLVALRLLQVSCGAFNGSPTGNAILNVLNRHNVTLGSAGAATTRPMGDFLNFAYGILYPPSSYPNPPATPVPTTMPTAWDPLGEQDNSDLLDAMQAALAAQAPTTLAPQGRFQDPTREYRLRLFFRVKSEHPQCPPELVWSRYSDPFMIAAWYNGGRNHPPIPLPDPTLAFLKSLKPNCFFQVPGSLMSAMQGTTLSGLMNGKASSSGVSLGWICGFSIPLITICAFFVLNIFLILLNLVFFWLPFIKICIPFPMPSPSDPDANPS